MKKALSLLLALVLCLSLAACGGDISENNELSSNDTGNTIATVPGSPMPIGTQETLDWLPCFFGEWQVLNREDVGKIEAVTFREDGTVSIGSQSLTWIFDSAFDTNMYVDLLAGEDKVGYLSLSVAENGDISAMIYMNDVYIHLYKPSHYEIIPITLENVNEYFETQYEWEINENAFGEMEGIEITRRYVLKDAYQSRISSMLMNDSWDRNVVDSGAIEWSYEMGQLDLHLDVETQTISYLEFIPRESKTSVSEPIFSDYLYFGFPFGRRSYSPGPFFDLETGLARENNTAHNCEVLRIKLDLYLLKEYSELIE